MEKKKPLILVSNDDGYRSKGLRSLLSMIGDLGEVIVCAPDSGRSGYACAFSVLSPLFLTRHEDVAAAQVWSCSGTPVDCVKLALAELCGGRKPDLVIGGINHGDNASVNAHYSGTMGVALEGCMKYIPSVAFSLCDHREDAVFEPLRPYVRSITRRVLDDGLPEGVCLNVNFPVAEVFKGVRICRMAHGTWGNEIARQHHPRGCDYYWMIGTYTNDEPEQTDTDNWALQNGYVAITPTRIDVTDYDSLKRLEQWKL